MDGYVVDANLVFSSILNLRSGISTFIQKKQEYGINFFAPEYLKVEIANHHADLLKVSKLTSREILYARDHIYDYVTFFDDDAIPFEEYIKAMRIVRNIDPDDVTFVALNNFLGKKLWTGDLKLYRGLKQKGYEDVVVFQDLQIYYTI